MGSEKRREDRLKLDGVSLWIKHKDGATICEVLNISRLGIGLHIPDDKTLESIPTLHIETVLDATLKFDRTVVPIGLRVLRVSGTELGCAFVFGSEDSQRRIFEVLSPRFVAQSLVPVAPGKLSSHLKYAYFGQDFYFLCHADEEKLIISSSGYDCVVTGVEVSVSEHGLTQENRFNTEIFRNYDMLPHPKQKPADVVDWIGAVFEVWDDAPVEVKRLIPKLKAYHDPTNA